MIIWNLHQGKTYRVTWRYPKGRQDHTLVARYIGESADGEDYFFDLRPTAGTQKIRKAWVLLIEMTH